MRAFLLWRTRTMFAAILFAIALPGFSEATASSCAHPQPGWIFCEDFESGHLDGWDADTRQLDAYRAIVERPGPAQQVENRVLRLRIPAGRGGLSANKTFTPSQYDVLYARWYVAYEPGFDFSARNHGGGLHAGDRWKKGVAGNRPNGDDWFTTNVEHLPSAGSEPARTYIYTYYRGMQMDCSNPDGACWGDHIPCMLGDRYCDRAPHLRVATYSPPLQHEQWYCVEVMVDAGDPASSADEANGVLNLWVDGLQVGPWHNMWFRTSPDVRLNHFWLGLFHHEDHSVEGILFDDVVVGTERIGCGNAAPARPLPPGNVRVN